MRVAVILAILARLIDEHIYNPNFLFEGGSETRHVFLRLAIESSDRESFCRALFATSLVTEQERTVDDRIGQIIHDMLQHVGGLLSDEKYDRFEEDLEHMIQGAHDLWKAIAWDRRYFEPSFRYGPSPGVTWRSFCLPEREEGLLETDSRDNPGVLVVFPRLYIVENNREPVSISAGTLLRKSQTLEATNEIDREESDVPGLSPTIPRAMSNRQKSRHVRGTSATQRNGLGVQPFLD